MSGTCLLMFARCLNCCFSDNWHHNFHFCSNSKPSEPLLQLPALWPAVKNRIPMCVTMLIHICSLVLFCLLWALFKDKLTQTRRIRLNICKRERTRVHFTTQMFSPNFFHLEIRLFTSQLYKSTPCYCKEATEPPQNILTVAIHGKLTL